MAIKVNKKALAIVVVVILAAGVGTVSVYRWALNKEARSREFLKEARELAAQGQADQAVIQYRSAITNDPKNVPAQMELADIYFRQGDMTQAYEYYRSASKEDPSNVEALSRLAGLYHLGGRWEDLRKAAAMIISLSPGGTTEAQAHHYLAQAYYRDGDWRQAAAEFAKAAEMNPADVDAVLAQALVSQEKLGAPKDAQLALKTLLGRAGDESLDKAGRAEAAVRAAKFYWATGKSSDAETMLQSAVVLAGDQVRFRIELGDFYKRRGRDAESVALAEKAYLDALAVDPKSPSAALALGVFYRETGRTDKAIEVFRSAVSASPAPLLYQYLVEGLIDKGDLTGASAEIAAMRKLKNAATSADYLEGRVALAGSRGTALAARKAEDLFRKVAKLRPGFMPARYYLGLVLASRGLLDDAAVEFQKALELVPDFGPAAVALAETYMRSFQYDKAITQARAVLARDGSDYYANLIAGRALAAQGNLTSARAFLNQARALRPASSEPYIALADVVSRQGKLDEAISILDEAAKQTADTARALVAAAALYQQHGDGTKALEAAAAACARTEDPFAASFYASLLWQAGRAQDALDFLARRAEQYSSRADYLTLLGNFQRSMGKNEESIDSYKRALAIGPDDPGALAGMASALAALGKTSDARRSLETLRKADPGSPAADVVEAGILVSEGKSDAAAALLENSLRQNAANPEAYYRLALIEQARGEPDKAIENLGNALKYQPAFVAARLALAQMYYQTRFYEDALREAREVAGAPDAGVQAVSRAAAIAIGSLVETGRVNEAISQWSSLPPEIKNSGDYMVKLGYLYLAGQDYARAEEAFKNAAGLLEEPSASLEGLARVYIAQNRLDEAAAAAAEALSKEIPSAAKVRLLQLSANVALARGDADGAAAVLSKMQEAAGKDAALLVQTGDAFAAIGRTDNALEAYKLAAAGAPDAGVAQARIVNALLAQGKAKDAGELADKMLGRSPADFDLLALKARTLLAQDTPGAAAQAAGILSSAIEAKAVRGRDTAAARLLLGSIYYRLGQMSTAENQLRRALSEDPTLLAARIALAKTLVANRAYEDAAVEANEVLRQDPSAAEAYGVLGDVAISRGEVDTAVANFRKALSLRRDRAVLLALVNVLKKAGKSAEAVAEIQAFLAADPSDADAARLLAAAYEDQGNLAGAEDMLKQLVAADGTDAASVYALSRVYKSEGKLQEARSLLEASIKTNPAPFAYRLLAGVETLAGQQADAEATLREAVKRYGDYREAYDDLAALLATGGRSAEAVAVLKDGVAANRDKEAFYESLGGFYLARNMPGDAEKFLKDTAQANPKFVGVQLMLAGAYLARGQKAEALAALETAVKFSPDDPRAANALAYALAEDGADSQRAVKLASFAVTRMPESADALDTLGWAYYRDGQFANAVASLSRAADASGAPSPPMLYHLTLAYAKVGAAERARETAQKLVALDGSYGQRQDVKEILSQQ